MATSTAEGLSSGKEKFHFFWQSHSVFSQWYPAGFSVNNINYSSAEQYMMHQKAVLFKDHESADKIMKTKDPKTQKALGRKVKNFDGKLWNENCVDIVKRGNLAKFSQHEEFKEVMLSTYPKILVEASPHDQIWGIGLKEDNPLAWDQNTWCGKNLLGFALTEVRDQLMKENVSKK
ncbi:hypothetical protein SNE40_004511 [Patella caerulea]|uniref:NADAR domain-containing protein n=1 Tax=Patella caerulea TaxID=87958 RepID=A0AAN8K9L2_PATCE